MSDNLAAFVDYLNFCSRLKMKPDRQSSLSEFFNFRHIYKFQGFGVNDDSLDYYCKICLKEIDL